jgi:uracil-DNA glycosylase
MGWVLRELISIVQPTYFLTLGKEATEWMGYVVERMRDMNGQELSIRDRWVYPSFHPSYIQRLKNQGMDAEEYLKEPLLLIKRRTKNG